MHLKKLCLTYMYKITILKTLHNELNQTNLTILEEHKINLKEVVGLGFTYTSKFLRLKQS